MMLVDVAMILIGVLAIAKAIMDAGRGSDLWLLPATYLGCGLILVGFGAIGLLVRLFTVM